MTKLVQGKGRTPSYQLPGDNFTYGHVNKWDSEGAGQVALTWVKGKLSGTQRGRWVFLHHDFDFWCARKKYSWQKSLVSSELFCHSLPLSDFFSSLSAFWRNTVVTLLPRIKQQLVLVHRLEKHLVRSSFQQIGVVVALIPPKIFLYFTSEYLHIDVIVFSFLLPFFALLIFDQQTIVKQIQNMSVQKLLAWQIVVHYQLDKVKKIYATASPRCPQKRVRKFFFSFFFLQFFLAGPLCLHKLKTFWRARYDFCFFFRGSSLSIHCIVGEIMKPSRLQMQAFDQNYPDMSGQQMSGKMPMPRPTHGSNLLYQNARLPKSTEQENTFKMKKFLRVEGRVNSNNKRRK